MRIEFDRDTCLNLEEAMRNEWLETDGCGGYAASTILGCHNRKYHGLLIMPVAGLQDRHVLLGKVETSVEIEGRVFDLGTNKFPEVFHPTGHQFIESVTVEHHPSITWRIGDARIRRSIQMLHGEHAVLIRYDYLEGTRPLTLALSPWLPYRSVHDLQHENMFLRVRSEADAKGIRIEPYASMPPLYIHAGKKMDWYAAPDWIRSIEYMKEWSRGYPHQEDLFCPGTFERSLKPGESLFLRAATTAPGRSSAKALWSREEKRRLKMAKPIGEAIAEEPVADLAIHADRFVIHRPATAGAAERTAIIAGWPWLEARTRDSMVALEGVGIGSGRAKLAAEVLLTLVAQADDGLVPSELDTGLEANGHSVEATLWFAWALSQAWDGKARPKKAFKDCLPVLTRLIERLLHGGVPDARLQEDGLLLMGRPDHAHTWMDASVAGRPVTPRTGCAVELNALWYHLLCTWLERAPKKGEHRSAVEDLVGRLPAAFRARFWTTHNDESYLADVAGDGWNDPSVRPNQLWAAALPHSMLEPAERRQVVAACQHRLATPFGMRTLGPAHPHYKGMYGGSPAQRDAAQHQGPVVAWLVGAYIQASLRDADDRHATAEKLRSFFAPLWQQHSRDHGLFAISEMMNGDPPHKPRGCFAQAWCVGEAIRSWHLLDEVKE